MWIPFTGRLADPGGKPHRITSLAVKRRILDYFNETVYALRIELQGKSDGVPHRKER
jgi:hypothetical protein